MNISEVDKAYMAGLFDGEGCVGYYNRNGRRPKPAYSASVILSMTDPRPINWLAETTQLGKVTIITNRPSNRRTVYSWQISNQPEIRQFLTMIKPYLKLKADQVDVLLAHWEFEDKLPKGAGSVTDAVIQRRIATAEMMKSLKSEEGVETRRAGSVN